MDLTPAALQRQLAAAHEEAVARIVVAHWKAVAAPRLEAVRQRTAHTADFLARVHWRTALLRKVLAAWRHFVVEHRAAQQQRRDQKRLRGQQQVVQAVAARQFFLLRIHLYLWHCQVKAVQHDRSVVTRAAQHHARRVLRRAVAAWRLYAALRKRRRIEDAEATELLLVTRKHHLYHRWKRRLWYCQALHHAFQALQRCYGGWCLRLAFRQWRGERQWARYLHWAEGRAREHFTAQLQHRAFAGWHAVVRRRQQQLALDRGRLEQFRFDADRRLRRRTLRRWLQAAFQRRGQAARLARAAQHHRRRLLARCLLRLLRYVDRRRRKALLRAAADQHHLCAAKKSALAKWQARHAQRLTLLDRLEAARQWRQRFGLRRALGAWRRYAAGRRRKREEEGEVLHARHVRLLKTGVAKWLEVGLALRAQRVFAAAARDAELAYRRHRALQTLVLRWRRTRCQEPVTGDAQNTPNVGMTSTVTPSLWSSHSFPTASLGVSASPTQRPSLPIVQRGSDGRRPPPQPGMQGRVPPPPTFPVADPLPLTPVPASVPISRPPPRRPTLLDRDTKPSSSSPVAAASPCPPPPRDPVMSTVPNRDSRPASASVGVHTTVPRLTAARLPVTPTTPGSLPLPETPAVDSQMTRSDVATLLQELRRVQGSLSGLPSHAAGSADSHPDLPPGLPA
eukprot:EG_transcript_3974